MGYKESISWFGFRGWNLVIAWCLIGAITGTFTSTFIDDMKTGFFVSAGIGGILGMFGLIFKGASTRHFFWNVMYQISWRVTDISKRITNKSVKIADYASKQCVMITYPNTEENRQLHCDHRFTTGALGGEYCILCDFHPRVPS